jgi:hypothetical protein
MFELVHLMLNLLQATERSEGRLMNSRAVFKLYVLVQESESNSFRAHDVASICGFFARHETKDGSFARTVATNETDVFTGIYLQRGAAQDVLHAI